MPVVRCLSLCFSHVGHVSTRLRWRIAPVVLITLVALLQAPRVSPVSPPNFVLVKVSGSAPGAPNQAMTGAAPLALSGGVTVPGFLNTAANVGAGLQANGLPTMSTVDVRTGDFNGDGIPDIAALSVAAGPGSTTPNVLSLVIYPGIGDGTFAQPQVYQVAETTGQTITFATGAAVAAGNFDADNLGDLVLTAGLALNGSSTLNNRALLVFGKDLFNTPVGGTVPTLNFTLNGQGVAVAAGQLTSDPFNDFVVAERGNPGAVEVFLHGSPTLGFTAPTAAIQVSGITGSIGLGTNGVTPIAEPRAIAIGQSNFPSAPDPSGAITLADRDLDVFIATGGGIQTAINNPGVGGTPPTFAVPSNFGTLQIGTPSAAVFVGDVNGDGIPDVIGFDPVSGSVSVFFGNPLQPGYGAAVNSPIGPATTFEYDQIGHIIATADANPTPSSSNVQLFSVNSTGNLTLTHTFNLASSHAIINPTSVALGALNTQSAFSGIDDLVITDGSDAAISPSDPGGVEFYDASQLFAEDKIPTAPATVTNLTLSTITFTPGSPLDVFIQVNPASGTGGPINGTAIVLQNTYDPSCGCLTNTTTTSGSIFDNVGSAAISLLDVSPAFDENISVSFVGNSLFAGSSASIKIHVGPPSPTTNPDLAASATITPPGPYHVGDSVVINVTVKDSTAAAAAPNVQEVAFVPFTLTVNSVSAGTFDSFSQSGPEIFFAKSSLAPGGSATGTINATVNSFATQLDGAIAIQDPNNPGHFLVTSGAGLFAQNTNVALDQHLDPRTVATDPNDVLFNVNGLVVGELGVSVEPFLHGNLPESVNLFSLSSETPTSGATFTDPTTGLRNLVFTYTSAPSLLGSPGQLLLGTNTGAPPFFDPAHFTVVQTSPVPTQVETFQLTHVPEEDIYDVDPTEGLVVTDGLTKSVKQVKPSGGFAAAGLAIADLTGAGNPVFVVLSPGGIDPATNSFSHCVVTVLPGMSDGTAGSPTQTLPLPGYCQALSGGVTHTLINGTRETVNFNGQPGFVVLTTPITGPISTSNPPDAIVLVDDPANPGTLQQQTVIPLPELVPTTGNTGPWTLRTAVLRQASATGGARLFDIVAGNGAGTVVTLLNNGTNPVTFTKNVYSVCGSRGPVNILFGDYNASGLLGMGFEGCSGNNSVAVEASSLLPDVNPADNVAFAPFIVQENPPAVTLVFPTSGKPGDTLLVVPSNAEFATADINGVPASIIARGSSLVLDVPPGAGTTNMADTLTLTTPDGKTSMPFSIAPGLGVTTNSVDFGNVAPGQLATKAVTLTNIGGGSLTFSPVTLDPASSSEFLITQPVTPTVGPNQTTTFDVVFNSSAAGLATGIVHVTSNGGNADFNLSGLGIAACAPIQVFLNGVSPGKPVPGTVGALYPSASQQPQLFHPSGGVGPYTISSSSLPPGFSFNPLPGDVFAFVGQPTQAGTFTFTVTFTDSIGCTGSATFTIVISPANTTATVTSSADPSVFGQAVAFTATLTETGGGTVTPTGSVQIMIDGSPFGTPLTLNGSGVATSPLVSNLTVGTHIVLATYSADPNNNSSSGSLTQTVNQAGTTITESSSANPAVYGQPITFSATVNSSVSGVEVPTGIITFTEGSLPPVTATVNNTGHAIATLQQTLTPGTYSVTATYSGDTNFLTSTASSSEVVIKGNTTLTITSSANPSIYGQPDIIAATVAAAFPATGTPTGTVQFQVDGVNVGPPSPLVNGQAGIPVPVTSTFNAGSRIITAIYSGDLDFTGQTGTATQIVNPAPTITVVNSSLNPDPFGQAVVFTATVTEQNGGTGSITGPVQFSVDGVPFGPPSSVLNGIAISAPFTATGLGTNMIGAIYNADANNLTSTALPLIQVTRPTDADLGILGSTTTTPVPFGGTATVNFFLRNLGPEASANATAVVGLPGGLTFNSQFGQPCAPPNSLGVIQCIPFSLGFNGTATLGVNLTSPSTAERDNNIQSFFQDFLRRGTGTDFTASQLLGTGGAASLIASGDYLGTGAKGFAVVNQSFSNGNPEAITYFYRQLLHRDYDPAGSIGIQGWILALQSGSLRGDPTSDDFAAISLQSPPTPGSPMQYILQTFNGGSSGVTLGTTINFTSFLPPNAVIVPGSIAFGQSNLPATRTGTGQDIFISVGSPTAPSGAGIFIFQNNGTGSLSTVPVVIPIPLVGGSGVTVADINNDGRPDLLVGDYAGNRMLSLLATNSNSYSGATTVATGTLLRGFATGDFNEDGKLDLAITEGSATPGANGNLEIFNGDGTGNFSHTLTLPTGKDPDRLIVTDVNGDGVPDLVIANKGDGTVQAYINQTPLGATVETFMAQTNQCGDRGPVDLVGIPAPGSLQNSVLLSGCEDGATATGSFSDPTAVDPFLNDNTTRVLIPLAPIVPQILNFSPQSGIPGTVVMISGTTLTDASVSFNGIPAATYMTNGGAILASVPLGATTGPITVTNLGGTATSTSPFVVLPPTVPIILTTAPTGLSVSGDGGATFFPAPHTFQWAPGSMHTIVVPSPQTTSPGTQEVWNNWSDNGPISHQITTPSAGTTLTATFGTLYQLHTAVSPAGGGTVKPLSGGFFAAGSTVSVSASANAGFKFSIWTGPVANPTNPNTTVTMNAPVSIKANFKGSAPTVNLVTTIASASHDTTRKRFVFQFRVANNGTGAAGNVQATAGTITVGTNSPVKTVTALPVVVGSIPAGGFTNFTLEYPDTVGLSGAPAVLRTTLTYHKPGGGSGTASASLRTALP